MINTMFQKQVLGLQDYLMNFAYSLTSNREEARDLLQETTLKVLDNEGKYTDNVNFKGWMSTIMRNLFINHYRMRKRHATVLDQTDDLYQINSAASDDSITPEDTISAKEIMETVNTFSDSYRVPFVLYIKGYKYVEIADQLHLPLGTVKSRIFFARKRLRMLLADYRD